ncbi:MAG: hypothetical protein ABUT39_29170 [Acidobacteriota bacterium]
MLVYGDLVREEETGARAERIRSGLAALAGMPAGIGRHAEIAGLLVEMGELEQGLLDDQLQLLGRERPTPLAQWSAAVTRGIAEALLWSFRFAGQLPAWEGRRAAAPPLVGLMSAARALKRLTALRLPSRIPVVTPEGYSLYGVYPETYLRASEQLREDWQGVLRVIGIRSIGTSLAAMVAAAGRGETSASVRPGGHPLARSLSIGVRMTGKLLAAAGAQGARRPLYAIVDEGPGLSGSSFGAVADWLEEHGVSAESIVFFPSHRGPLGPKASPAHRERWDRARRYVVEFEDLFLGPGATWPLERWVEDLTGPADGPLEDLGAGLWRDRHFPGGDRPPAHLQRERRKYLLTSRGKTWLLKFAGLGHYGRERLELAQELEKGGFIPPVAGLRHGFLVGPWLDRARPLSLVPDVDREALLDRVARYLSFRARRLPAEGRPGASPAKLLEMASFNAGEALGPQASEALGVWKERLPELASLARPVLTDNRMHAWEWLVTPEGKILKADALDHHAGNDLIGAQDPAWDLAGAVVELELSDDERGRLVEMLERSRRVKTPPDQLRFYTHAYLAFQLGWQTLAAEALEGIDPAEAGAMRKRAESYRERLRREL